MKVIFRVDASSKIGLGHLMRCVTLANALKEKGHEIKFIMRSLLQGPALETLILRNISVSFLPMLSETQQLYPNQTTLDDYPAWLGISQQEDARQTVQTLGIEEPALLIVDHYSLDAVWEEQLRPKVRKLMVIDDLANRYHCCDILLDQNFYLDCYSRYDHLVPTHCQKLLGPNYVLLRPEFSQIKALRKRLGKFEPHLIKNVLLYMGGADPQNTTKKILQTLMDLPEISQYQINVVIGALNPHRKEIETFCESQPFLHCFFQPKSYNQLLAEADLAIAAGGSSTYERCFILLPSLVFAIAENQIKLAQDVSKFGAHFYAELNNISKLIPTGMASIQKNFNFYLEKMALLLDGQGLQRVCTEISYAT